MGFLCFSLELYFAVTLGVSGLAKINNPNHFATALHQQRIFPTWSIQTISKTLPWIEIAAAFLIISGIMAFLNAIALIALFSIFLCIKIYLLVTNNDADCGCYGSSGAEKVDKTSVIVSTLLVLLASMHLWLILHVTLAGWQWRLLIVILFLGAGSYLLKKIVARQGTIKLAPYLQTENIGGLNIGEKAPSFTAIDQYNNTIHLNDFRGRRLLTFISPGCSLCPKALEALEHLTQNEQNILGLVVGSSDHERNQVYLTEHKVNMPFMTPNSDDVKKLYKIRAVPLTLLIDEEGVIRAKGIANRIEQLQQLLAIAAITFP